MELEENKIIKNLKDIKKDSFNNFKFNQEENNDEIDNENIDSPYPITHIFRDHQYFRIWNENGIELEQELDNHIMVFGAIEKFEEFLNTFDSFYKGTIFYVSDIPPPEMWAQIISYRKNLIYLECFYSDLVELKKLNLLKAKQVFILSWVVEGTRELDFGILPLVKRIEEYFPGCNYTVELLDFSNMRY